jgi:hypothetical protein
MTSGFIDGSGVDVEFETLACGTERASSLGAGPSRPRARRE